MTISQGERRRGRMLLQALYVFRGTHVSMSIHNHWGGRKTRGQEYKGWGQICKWGVFTSVPVVFAACYFLGPYALSFHICRGGSNWTVGRRWGGQVPVLEWFIEGVEENELQRVARDWWGGVMGGDTRNESVGVERSEMLKSSKFQSLSGGKMRKVSSHAMGVEVGGGREGEGQELR
eukprot:761416-Hanusia_phi.AAC.3